MTYLKIDLYKTGNRISELRKKNNITIKTLQEELGFNTPQAIYKWQRGECLPTVDNLVILAHIFDVNVDDLLVICND